MAGLLRSLLVVSLVFMALTALTGSVFRWIHTTRELEAKRLDVKPPFEKATPGKATRQPVPTGAWWTNLLLDEGGAATTTPYSVRGAGGGLEVSYGASHRTSTATNVVDAFVADVRVGTSCGDGVTNGTGGRVVSRDDLTARYAFGGCAIALLARGSPYVTVEVRSSLHLSSDVGIASLVARDGTEPEPEPEAEAGADSDSDGPTPDATPRDGGESEARTCAAHAGCGGLQGDCCPTAEGAFLDCCSGGRRSLEATPESDRFEMTLGDGRVWLIYASSPLAFAKTGSSYAASFRGTLRLAHAPDAAAAKLLDVRFGVLFVGPRGRDVA